MSRERRYHQGGDRWRGAAWREPDRGQKPATRRLGLGRVWIAAAGLGTFLTASGLIVWSWSLASVDQSEVLICRRREPAYSDRRLRLGVDFKNDLQYLKYFLVDRITEQTLMNCIVFLFWSG